MAEYQVTITTENDSAIIGQRVNITAVVIHNESEMTPKQLQGQRLSLQWAVSPEGIRLLTDAEEPHIVMLEAEENGKPGVYNISVSLSKSEQLVASASSFVTFHDYSRCSATGIQYKPNTFMDAVHSYIEAEPHAEDEALKRLLGAPTVLFQGLETLLSELELHTNEALQGQELISQIVRFKSKWLKVAVILLNSKYPSEAKTAFLRLYQIVRSQEIAKKGRFHKGTILWWLARANQELGNIDEAKKHFLLAMTEDIRTDETTWRKLGAWDWLVNSLQIEATTVDHIGKLSHALLISIKWDPREPELTWLRLRRQRYSISRAPLDFVKAVSEEFLKKARNPTTKKQEKGDDLEYLLAYLFATEMGFEVLGPTRSPDSQNDVLVRNRHDDKAILSLGDYLIIECKNWEKPASASVVREFASRLRTAKVKTGVLASKMGITGAKRRSGGARDTIGKEYLHDSTAILVLDEQSIVDLSSGKISVSARLLEEFENVRFDLR